MPSLEPYKRSLPYSYAPGLFPAMEALNKRPDLVRRLLIHSKLADGEARQAMLNACAAHNIRVEQADRVLNRMGKGNVYAAAVFGKEEAALNETARHLVLCQPADMGNLGTILRSALGFGFLDIAIIRPAADVYDPQVVRSSMGAMFSLRVSEYDSFEQYRGQFPLHHAYPFMLTGAAPLENAARTATLPYALVMGNEGSGLPQEYAALGTAVRISHSGQIDSLNLAVAASIGMYAFEQAENSAL